MSNDEDNHIHCVTCLLNYALLAFALQNDNEKARRLGQESLRIFELLGHRKVAEVTSWLEALPALTKIDEQ